MTPAGATEGFNKTAEREVYAGEVIRVLQASFTAPDGERFERDVVRHLGAVAVVALDGDEVILVRQYRSAVEQHLLEIPAGRRDVPGEAPEATARRELIEEAGLDCEHIHRLGSFYNSPGFCDELTHLFVATGLSAVPNDPDGAEEKWMSVTRVALADVADMIESGRIIDAKTVIGLQAVLARGDTQGPPK